jgi:myo-inositol-1(or 4)-monophosphatase
MDLALIKRTGIGAAFRAAKTIRRYMESRPPVEKKGAIDFVTQADRDSEAVIISTIRNRFPDHGVLAEESGLSQEGATCRWIIDPLDGTTNFIHGLGLFCISIVFQCEDEILVGIVLDPVSGELFSAVRGQGACLGNQPISVTRAHRVADSLLVTGFPYNLKSILPTLMQRFAAVTGASLGVRRLGSAALDLCYVDCGRFDGFWEQNLNPWDTAAGFLIAAEAGAMITDFSNQLYRIEEKEILATNGRIHEEMISLLAI